ncbi:terminase small subunit [Dyella japonica]|uniref:terminase small subunit n=1 Tax=Dyella japonica TaxID=231455 RepID=UPI00062D92EB|nr:terminase small subunit [Dyella japonica]
MARKDAPPPAKNKAVAKTAARKAAKKAPQQHAVPRADLFVLEYLKDMNGRQAAIRAGYSPISARQTASDLLATPEIQQKVAEAMAARSEATGIEGQMVLDRFWAIATADPRDLIELHRVCCRYCYGKGHRYQRTPKEMNQAEREHKALVAAAEKDAKIGEFDPEGGIGFNPYRDPHPDCPECFGEGEERVVAKDTRDLSPAARLLYAGVKTTQHGLEIKTHDQVAALRDVGKHLGLFKEKVELTGKDGGPLKHTMTDLLSEIDGAGTGLPRHARAE